MTNEEKLQDLIARRSGFRFALGMDKTLDPTTKRDLLDAEASLTKQIEELQKEMSHE